MSDEINPVRLLIQDSPNVRKARLARADPRRDAVRLVILCALLAISPALSGCALTGAVWHDAGANRMHFPDVVAAAERGAGPGSARRSLVVRYELETGWRLQFQKSVVVLVPLGEAGEAAYPFGYTGPKRAAAEVLADLGARQQRGLAAATADLEAVPGGDPSRLKRFHSFPRGQTYNGWRPPDSNDREGLVVFAYRITHEGGVGLLPVDGPTFPPDARFLVLPEDTRRPRKEVAAARRNAALLTPLTVPADLIFTPTLFLLAILTGKIC